MGLAGSAVAGVQWHEILDAGGDRWLPCVGGVSQDLVVRQQDEGWIGHYSTRHVEGFQPDNTIRYVNQYVGYQTSAGKLRVPPAPASSALETGAVQCPFRLPSSGWPR